jgi:hypothetical protein
MRRQAKLPDECLAFEVVGGPYSTIPVGSTVEFDDFDGGYIVCFVADARMETWIFERRELRPLTPSARAALEMVPV